MFPLQKLLDEQLRELPKKALESQIKKKLGTAGEDVPQEIISKLAQHLHSGATNSVHWDDGKPDRKINIELTSEDISQIDDFLTRSLKTELPKILEEMSATAAKLMVRELKARWPERNTYEEAVNLEFRDRLYARWRKPLDLLRIILGVARDLGENQLKRHRRSKSCTLAHARHALSRLHARSCQVTAEIIALLESGFADGAMARWRTLHEITVIALLIADHGNDLAERYLAFDFVEAKNELDEYISTQVPIGSTKPPKRYIAHVQKNYNAIIAKYGKDFRKRNGWASHALKRTDVTFSNLEAAAKRSARRIYYKISSFNVHASPRSLAFSLSTPYEMGLVIAGASNAGLEEPGRQAAFDLVTVTMTIFGPKWKIDDLVSLRALYLLRDEAEKVFLRASTKLHKDDAAERKKKLKKQLTANS